jgi:succinylglutamic semialdehyde dehydrogenase
MSDMLRSYEPATGALLWEGAPSSVAQDAERVAASAPDWAAQPLPHRVELVRRFANSVRQHEVAFADLIARETGRPLWDARTEIELLASQVDRAVAAASDRAGQRRLDGALGARQSLRHRPLGVMAVISPASFPARIPGDQIAAALIAGNGVLFKPSEKTPAVGQALVDLYHAAGLPEDLLRCVIGGPEAGAALVGSDAIDGILFTGSTPTGLAIARALAGRPDKLLALNMGGNNPIIAWDCGDLASAAALIVQSAFSCAGQDCLNARRLIVPHDLAEPIVRAVRRLADRLIIDHPQAERTPYLGPVADMAAADALTDSFLHLMSHGGQPIKHMQRPFPDLPFVTPGIIDVTGIDPRPDQEIFGPLLQLIRVESFEAAVACANDTRYGLAAALIGGGPDHYDYFWARSRAAIVNWNRPTTAVPPGVPLGGRGLSGNNRPTGSYAADHCAYPAISSAVDQPRATIGVGLRPDGSAAATRVAMG